MKFLRRAVLSTFCFLFLASPVYSQQPSADNIKQIICEQTATIAYNVMAFRQSGAPIELQLAAVPLIEFEEFRPVVVNIISEAYSLPFVEHGWVKQRLTIDFAREWFRRCNEIPIGDLI